MEKISHNGRLSRLVLWRAITGTGLAVLISLTALPAPSFASSAKTRGSTLQDHPQTAAGNPIAQARAEAAALEHKISVDNVAAQIAAERFDQATVELALAKKRVIAVGVALVKEKAQTKQAEHRVQVAAVAAYVYDDSGASQVSSILNGTIATAGTISTYSGVATTALNKAVASLQIAISHLNAEKKAESKALRTARVDVTAAISTRQSAQSASNAAMADLSAVRGHIATLIAQQEAAAAAAAAARARAAAAAEARAQALAVAEARAHAKAARALAQRQAAADAAASASAQAQASSDATLAVSASAASPNASTEASASAATASANSVSGLGEPQIALAGTTTAGNEAVAAAESYLGVPYVWGGASTTGLDCSGLTMLAWGAAGIPLLHSAWLQYLDSRHVSLARLEPGDLLFYDFPNDGTTDPVSHVAMYVGSGPFGAQTIIQAPEPGRNVSYSRFYFNGFVGVGRP